MRLLMPLVLVLATTTFAQKPVEKPEKASGPRQAVATGGAPVVSEIAAVQVMLDRSGFSPGEIDGRAGANLKRALLAFQRAEGLTETGQHDQTTWERLSQRSGQVAPLVEYQLVEPDLAGPFVPDIPTDLVEQSKLKALAYRTPLEAIAERFHASPRLLQELNPGATFSQPGERVMVPNVMPFSPPPPEARERGTRGRGARAAARGRGAAAKDAPPQPVVTIAVSKTAGALTVEDESGKVIFHAPVTSGSERDPLPIGTWKVTTVHTMPVFNYNPALFWDADPTHSKARIAAGPNNPVGVAWIDLSKEHYGIHGTPEPSQVGHATSHGCVRLTNWDVTRLLEWVTPGMTVTFRE